MIMNEVKYAERLLETGYIGKKVYSTLSLLARYFYHKQGMKPAQIVQALNAYMSRNYEYYIADVWSKAIQDVARNAKKYGIREIESVGVSQSELDKIKTLEDEDQEKLMFTLLCLSKFYNLLSAQNNNWVNTDINDIFKAANVSRSNINERCQLIHKIYRKGGFISFSNKNDNLNIRVECIDDGEPALNVINLDALGYEYLNIENPKKFYRCSECGKLSKRPRSKGNYSKCKEHAGYQPKSQKMIRCEDCGKIMFVSSQNTKTKKCDTCSL